MTTYQIYENKIWNKARIHNSDCSFCNYGEGIHQEASDDNGWWSKPFDSLPEALAAAYKTGRKVSQCKRCMQMNLAEASVA